MNLFWLDTDPVLAAQAHQDIHVGKMRSIDGFIGSALNNRQP
jgi:hypothetical protein